MFVSQQPCGSTASDTASIQLVHNAKASSATNRGAARKTRRSDMHSKQFCTLIA